MIKTFLSALLLTCASATASFAADVVERLLPSALSFVGGASYPTAQLSIYGPDDFEATEKTSRGWPVFRVRGGTMQDGVYRYTLTAATDEQLPIKKKVNNGRGESARDFTFKSFHMQGIFRISRGLIEPLDDAPEDEYEG